MQPTPVWKTSPFSRLIIPLLAGIALAFYFSISITAIITSAVFLFLVFGLISFGNLHLKLKLRQLQGLLLILIIVCLGAWLFWQKDIRHREDWYGHTYKAGNYLILKLEENPVPKENSYKAEASVISAGSNNHLAPASGKMIIYFAKKQFDSSLKYGSQILINKDLQVIKNAGNPGGFNYERYAAFHQWFHTVYLVPGDYFSLNKSSPDFIKATTLAARKYVVSILQQHLSADKNVLGIAEALIIGYKEDLDKDLVQAYSNTGIVHLIAISGMHLGMIYLLLEFLFNILPFTRKSKKKIIPIILLLWAFALVTGGSPSVLRSAIMFSCILIGKNYFKQGSSFNGLAVSAFILLCYNPYYLWDVGFQLSYCAVAGIMWLQRPIAKLLYVQNKILNWIWQLATVSIAAQVATFPLSLYYFHQFPLLFLLVNICAIPFAMLALYTGVSLVILSAIPYLAVAVGVILFYLIKTLNLIVQFFNGLPFNLVDGIFSNSLSTIFLYLFVFAICYTFISKRKDLFPLALFALLAFVLERSLAFTSFFSQKKVVVYNVPRFRAVDFINATDLYFSGDSLLITDGVLRNFHLKPSRIAMQAVHNRSELPGLKLVNGIFLYQGKTILLADSSSHFQASNNTIPIDVLVVSRTAPFMNSLLKSFRPKIIVCDGTNSLWKIARYKKECEELHLPFHAVSEQGAYVLNID